MIFFQDIQDRSASLRGRIRQDNFNLKDIQRIDIILPDLGQRSDPAIL